MLRKSLWVLSAFILVVQGKKWKLFIILFFDIFRYIFSISYKEKFILSAHISFALHWFLATKVLCPLHFVIKNWFLRRIAPNLLYQFPLYPLYFFRNCTKSSSSHRNAPNSYGGQTEAYLSPRDRTRTSIICRMYSWTPLPTSILHKFRKSWDPTSLLAACCIACNHGNTCAESWRC